MKKLFLWIVVPSVVIALAAGVALVDTPTSGREHQPRPAPQPSRAEIEKAAETARINALVREGRIGIGMTRSEIRLIIGKPRKINETVGAYGTREQWVYSPPVPIRASGEKIEYVYFRDGYVTSYSAERSAR